MRVPSKSLYSGQFPCQNIRGNNCYKNCTCYGITAGFFFTKYPLLEKSSFIIYLRSLRGLTSKASRPGRNPASRLNWSSLVEQFSAYRTPVWNVPCTCHGRGTRCCIAAICSRDTWNGEIRLRNAGFYPYY